MKSVIASLLALALSGGSWCRDEDYSSWTAPIGSGPHWFVKPNPKQDDCFHAVVRMPQWTATEETSVFPFQLDDPIGVLRNDKDGSIIVDTIPRKEWSDHHHRHKVLQSQIFDINYLCLSPAGNLRLMNPERNCLPVGDHGILTCAIGWPTTKNWTVHSTGDLLREANMLAWNGYQQWWLCPQPSRRKHYPHNDEATLHMVHDAPKGDCAAVWLDSSPAWAQSWMS